MFYVYVLSSRSGGLCAAITHDIGRHIQQHRKAAAGSCTHSHQFDRLLLLEPFRRSAVATARERQINHCTLSEKLELIRIANPKFDDLGQSLQP